MTSPADRRTAGSARKALLARKKKIVRISANLVRGENALVPAGVSDPLDRAADFEAHEVLQRLQAVEAKEIVELDAALERVRKGTYGRCEDCGATVGLLRLQAVPEARLCMPCCAPR